MITLKPIGAFAGAIVMSLTSWLGLANDTPTISATELINNKSEYVVLDVRSAEEYSEGHIEGAINIPHTEIEEQLERLRSIDKTIVVHCRSGYRAGKAESIMDKNGITNFVHLEGDMLGWQKQSLPLVTPKVTPKS